MTDSPLIHRPVVLALALLTILSSTPHAVSQGGRDNDTDAKALRSWIALDAPPGWEHLATAPILQAMPGWRRDALGI